MQILFRQKSRVLLLGCSLGASSLVYKGTVKFDIQHYNPANANGFASELWRMSRIEPLIHNSSLDTSSLTSTVECVVNSTPQDLCRALPLHDDSTFNALAQPSVDKTAPPIFSFPVNQQLSPSPNNNSENILEPPQSLGTRSIVTLPIISESILFCLESICGALHYLFPTCSEFLSTAMMGGVFGLVIPASGLAYGFVQLINWVVPALQGNALLYIGTPAVVAYALHVFAFDTTHLNPLPADQYRKPRTWLQKLAISLFMFKRARV
jgi:hypothetical protein